MHTWIFSVHKTSYYITSKKGELLKELNDKKVKIGKLISYILKNSENLMDFVFLLNKLENIEESTDNIQTVLNDYLAICNNTLIEGKKKVRHIDDRHELHHEMNIGFLDVNKIEIITNAVQNNTNVVLPITIYDFKRRYKKKILRNNALGKKLKSILNSYRDGDEILEVVSSIQVWKQNAGISYVVLQREREEIIMIEKLML